MANFVYNNAKRALLAGEIDFDTHDIRVLLVMTNTTADTETDKLTLSGFTTLDEFDGAGYTRLALTTETVAVDTPNSRGEFDADDVLFPGLDAGTRSIAAIVIYKHVTNDADSVPIAYIDTGSGVTFPITPNGGSVSFIWNAEGILQLS